jgi:hypothetical protein
MVVCKGIDLVNRSDQGLAADEEDLLQEAA